MSRSKLRWVAVIAALTLVIPLATAGADVGQWSPARGPEGGIIWSLAVDPQHPQNVYAGALGGGVFKSVDSGLSWSFAGAGLHPGVDAEVVWNVAIDPQSPQVLYASVGGEDEGAVYKSIDGGGTWSVVKGDLGAGLIALAVDPVSP